jgi:hypothetical protein
MMRARGFGRQKFGGVERVSPVWANPLVWSIPIIPGRGELGESFWLATPIFITEFLILPRSASANSFLHVKRRWRTIFRNDGKRPEMARRFAYIPTVANYISRWVGGFGRRRNGGRVWRGRKSRRSETTPMARFLLWPSSNNVWVSFLYTEYAI